MSVSIDSNKAYWYVLLHLEPALIDRLLRSENDSRRDAGKPPLTWLIPFTFLERADVSIDTSLESVSTISSSSGTDAEENNTLRNYLHNFVFIKSSRAELDLLLSRDWNRLGRLHLHYCRSRDGHPLRITDEAMSPFIALIVEHRQKFSFRPYSSETLHAQKVRIRRGLFRGRLATVREAIQTSGGYRLTLSLPVFNEEFMLDLYECESSDVEVPGGENDVEFMSYFLNQMERDLLEILRRRVFRRETVQSRREDHSRLESYSLLGYMRFEEPLRQSHFLSLLLLCASLRRDKTTRDELIRQLQSFLHVETMPSNDGEAFVMASIFVATRRGSLRKTLKEYCQSRANLMPSLEHLMPIVKEIRTR